MEAIRIIPSRHYDKRRKEYNSLAFQNTGNPPGVSIIGKECILQPETRHADTSQPIMEASQGNLPYWRFPTEILPCACRIEQETSTSGDICHYNIRGLSDRSPGISFSK